MDVDTGLGKILIAGLRELVPNWPVAGSRNLGIAVELCKFTEFLHMVAIFSFVKTGDLAL